MISMLLIIDIIIKVVVVTLDAEVRVREILENQLQEILGVNIQEVTEIIGAIMGLVHLPLGTIPIDNKVQVILGGKGRKQYC